MIYAKLRRCKILLTIVLLLTFNIGSGQDKKAEDMLLACLKTHLQSNGIDLADFVHQYEELLVKEKILEEASSEGYWKLLEKISKQNGFEFAKEPSEYFINKLMLSFDQKDRTSYKNCMQLISEKREYLEKSKPMKIEMAFLQSKKQSPSSYAKIMLQHTVSLDFEHVYYKLALYKLYYMIDLDSGIQQEEEEKEADFYENSLELVVKDGKLWVAKKPLAMHELRSKVYLYVEKNNEKSNILLTLDPLTKYSFFVEIQEEIVKAISSLRNTYSLKHFSKEFSQLSIVQKEKIEKKYPLRIRDNVIAKD